MLWQTLSCRVYLPVSLRFGLEAWSGNRRCDWCAHFWILMLSTINWRWRRSCFFYFRVTRWVLPGNGGVAVNNLQALVYRLVFPVVYCRRIGCDTVSSVRPRHTIDTSRLCSARQSPGRIEGRRIKCLREEGGWPWVWNLCHSEAEAKPALFSRAGKCPPNASVFSLSDRKTVER